MPKIIKPRYIDANDLKKYALEYEFECTSDESAIFHMIENAPTVDAEPVRHGHWFQRGGITLWDYCSLCEHLVSGTMEYRYCPHCGAKMDEEASNDN